MDVDRSSAPAPPGVDGWAADAFTVLSGTPAVARVGLGLVEGGGRRLRFTASDRRRGADLGGDEFGQPPGLGVGLRLDQGAIVPARHGDDSQGAPTHVGDVTPGGIDVGVNGATGGRQRRGCASTEMDGPHLPGQGEGGPASGVVHREVDDSGAGLAAPLAARTFLRRQCLIPVQQVPRIDQERLFAGADVELVQQAGASHPVRRPDEPDLRPVRRDGERPRDTQGEPAGARRQPGEGVGHVSDPTMRPLAFGA